MTAAPREAPLSYRPGKDRAPRLAEFQKAKGLSQSDALHQLIDAGLEKFGYGAVPKIKPAKKERKPRAVDPEKWVL
jgi:hypothetical protein